MNRLLDNYIKRPLLYDVIFTVIVCTTVYFLMQEKHICITFSHNNLLNVVTELISSTISIAGFIVAILTIILTFKDAIRLRDDRNSHSQNGIEILFDSRHYEQIVMVFLWASGIMLLLFLLFCILSLIWKSLNTILFVTLILFGVLLIAFTVARCMLVLYSIIKLQTASFTK